ncbi:MAG: dTDP-4-dehydrorhamnose 3,5-epimerase family protein [Chloroflexota bacterium]
MEVIESKKLPGLLLIKPEVAYDDRGDHAMVYHKDQYTKLGLPEFVEHCISRSRWGVLRGIHADYAADKLYEVVSGRAWYLFIDCREVSSSFGEWEAYILSGDNRYQVYKPKEYANALVVLSDDTVLHYLQDSYYDKARQVTYRWDDPRFKIVWPISNPILSERDLTAGERW